MITQTLKKHRKYAAILYTKHYILVLTLTYLLVRLTSMAKRNPKSLKITLNQAEKVKL